MPMKRDYIKNPLTYIKQGSTRIRERPFKEDIIELYITQNKSVVECSQYFNLNKRFFQKILSEYNIIKDRKLVYQVQKKTLLEKDGVENVFQLESVKNKSKKTCLEKYGKEHFSQTIEYQNKNLKTRLKKYPQDPYNRKQFKETCLKKHDVENVFQLETIKEKSKFTRKIKYNNENFNNRKKFQQTNLEKYGYEHYSKTIDFKNSLESQKDIINQKRYNTKKKNKTFGKSNVEKAILNTLKTKYPKTLFQYKSELYPFPCDFYIPEIDTYIEYNGWWGHGKEPYIGSIEQLNIVETWSLKNTQQYKRAIETWTIRDALKRTTAKQNNLNYLEFFNLKEFMNWFNTIK